MAYVATMGYGFTGCYRPFPSVRRGWNGMGATTAQQIAIGAGAATGAFSAATAPTAGAIISGAGGTILAASPLAGPAAPVVAIAGAVVEAAGAVASFLHIGQGCGQSCITTSNWANQAEALLRQNISAYFAQPAPRLTTSQEVALQAFDAIWNQLATACAQVGGAAGQNCIGDRDAGSCKWKATGTPPWPGSPAEGSCWNWFNAYRDPIANDTGVVTPEQAAAQSTAAGGSILGGGATSSMLLPLLLIGGLVAVGVML